MSELIDGHTLEYWFDKLKLFISLHGGRQFWLYGKMNPCQDFCEWGKNGGCDIGIGWLKKRLLVQKDLKKIDYINAEKEWKGDQAVWCVEWIKYV